MDQLLADVLAKSGSCQAEQSVDSTISCLYQLIDLLNQLLAYFT